MTQEPRDVTQEQEGDEIDELAKEVRRLIESNRQFLERVNDEDFDDEEESEEPQPEQDVEDYEEL